MRILLATDCAGPSLLAETLVAKLPAFAGAQVTVLSVAPVPALFALDPDGLGPAYAAVEGLASGDSFLQLAESRAETAAERLRILGLRASPMVRVGDPASEILDELEEGGADLVALGCTGETGLPAALLGSVSRKVLSHARTSVLVARPYAGMDCEESGRALSARSSLSVVVGVDGSPGAEKAVEAVEACACGVRKATVAVAEPLSVLPAGVKAEALVALSSHDRQKARELAQATARRLEASIGETECRVETGRPSEVLRRVAVDACADLVVLGAKRHGVLERFLIGSVSYEVAGSAPCSVWVVRP
ncbi:MAG: universal stress protein [Fimbriimonadales bacterium]|nr:universal stress protein [Fimbriimonadales bacterium]